MEKAQIVDINDIVNNIIKQQAEPTGKDVWQTPEETISLGTGDCEDLAILKYYAATIAGYEAMVVTVDVKDYGPHVVCVVKNNKVNWVLDNIATEIVSLNDRLANDIDRMVAVSTINGYHNDPRFNEMRFRISLQCSQVIEDFFAKQGFLLEK